MKAVVLVVLLAACSSKSGSRTIRVAAASDLAKAFEEIGKEFEAKTKISVAFDFGSSGLMAKQIEQGAPYSMFAAANKEFSDQVVKAGRCDGATQRPYARGRVVIWTPAGTAAPVKLDELADERFKKISIANPEHAPYGRAAKQALEKAGVWSKIEDRIVMAENVQASQLYARNKNTDASLTALSLAVASDGGSFLQVDPALHDPLDQTLVVCGNGEDADAARKLVEFIGSREGREIMTRYGFLLPGETLTKKP